MKPGQQELIAEAKVNENASFLQLSFNDGSKRFIDMMTVSKDVAHFIAAAINEKIEREKGEREDGFLKALDERIKESQKQIEKFSGMKSFQGMKDLLFEERGKEHGYNIIRDIYISITKNK